MNNECYAAIDLGASSGRVVIGYIEGDNIQLKEIYRFDNTQVRKNNHDCWDINKLETEILKGLKACKGHGFCPKSIGIDTWAVDFVPVDKNGNAIGDCVAYRDERTKGIMDENDVMTFDEIYSIAGIQKLQFNSLYQYIALKRENPEIYNKTYKFLMVPDYFAYVLCGIMSNEYTNCSSTSMLNAKTCQWDKTIFEKFQLDVNKHLEPTMPGKTLGKTLPWISEYIGYEADVVLVATHDTGSAYLSVPAKNENSVYLSSGTWSLLGCEIFDANTNDEARLANFTNEGGYEKRYRFLKNIMGLWIIQCVRRELNGVSYVEGSTENVDLNNVLTDVEDKEYSFVDLSDEAHKYRDFDAEINVNDDRFLSPKNMTIEIINACKENNQSVPQTVGQLMQCIYVGLANCYRAEIKNLENILDKKMTSLNIVGGGCQDEYLNQLTANATNLDVYAGPIEGTSIGNLGVQMISDKKFNSLEDLRKSIFNSFGIKTFKPQH